MKDRPFWLTLFLAVLLGCCLGAALFWGWLNFRSGSDSSVVVEPTVAIIDGEDRAVATRLPRPTDVIEVEIANTPIPTVSPEPTETAVSQQQEQQQQLEPTTIPTSVPTAIPPTEVPQVITDDTSNGGSAPTTQTVSFAEPEFAEFISQQATALGLELTDTQAEFSSGQGTITGNLNTFGLRMGTELAFTLVAEDGEPQLTVTNGTIGNQPMPRQIIEQIETAFEQGVKSGLQTNGEVFIDSIQLDNGLMTVSYSQ